MSSLQVGTDTIRKSFNDAKDNVPVPNLIEIQSKSFNDFVQLDYLPSERQILGLEKVLQDIFPIDYNEKMSLDYISYELGSWACTCGKLTGIENRYAWYCPVTKKSGTSSLVTDKSAPKTARYKTCLSCLSRVTIQLPMDVDECRANGQTFSLPLKVKVQLICWDGEGKDRIVRDIKEQDIFFADVPIMADIHEKGDRLQLGTDGTFLINGIDRVVVSQLHRSPGAVFSQSKKIKDVRGRPYYLARIIPMRGSWMDFEFDSSDNLYVRIDKKKKILITTFLQALGIPREEIISHFYQSEKMHIAKGKCYSSVDNSLIGRRIDRGMIPEKHEADFLGHRIDKTLLSKLTSLGVKKLSLEKENLINRVFAQDLINPETGEVLAEQGETLIDELYAQLLDYDKLSFELVSSSGYVFQPTLATTLLQDQCTSQNEALKELHSKVWPGDNSTLEEVKERLENMFFNARFYDLTSVGRIRLNRKLGLSIPEDVRALTREDIVGTIKYLLGLRERAEGELDDIDHLGNRRVRLVGELLSNQVYLGFLRIERIVRERFRMQEAYGTLMPQDLLNVKPLSAVLREFFGTGQLSQFMDQTNPLAEVAHKRRLSALGPGGVMKDRATFEIRDVHTSHYGRICPIETPEGQTIGLISSLASYAMVNDLGFIETAYRPVKNGKIQKDVVFMDAFQESGKYIAQADAVKTGKNTIEAKHVVARHETNFMPVDASLIDYIDLSPKQLVSVSTALIPFLEHDDASRALMGANMQRQAVPLIKTQSPLVGTGMEREIGKSSSVSLTARRDGVVEYVSGDRIIISSSEKEFGSVEDWAARGIDTYHLKKFQKSSMSTWIHHVPIVKAGQKVHTGDVLTNGSAMDHGELALGTNLLVAFMPWHGYNFEDAIVLNKRLVSDDVMTSVTIDEYMADARDTKLGPEEITRDIPNASESALSALDEDGIIKIGSRVKPGDVLVGKVTLKGDIQYSPEEKLLRAIFGEKSREVRDTSLRVQPGVEGMITDVKIFSRSGIRKDKRYKEEVFKEVKKLEEHFAHHTQLLEVMIAGKIADVAHGNKPAGKGGSEYLSKGVFDKAKCKDSDTKKVMSIKVADKKVSEVIKQVITAFDTQLHVLANLKEEKINRLKKGDPLPSGVIKMVKVYIAQKRTIKVGDKIAGRHGNKGVVSTIVPREDMPYMEDGIAVDIVLNPIGVPARMNVGQILETILGFAGREAGKQLQDIIDTKGQDEVNKFLAHHYGADLVKDFEKNYGKDGLKSLAQRTAKDGVRYEVPVFEAPKFEEDIKPILKDLNLPESATYTLRDGRTGQLFDQPVTVGTIYMMKLNHMADDKLHARSVGPYSLVTQQPLGGKAQMGGQRLGEMEVWALKAHGAAYTLQEMLTYKSDDVTGRHRVYEAIVRNDKIPEPGLPESFNVLIKELQSLGVQVDLCKVSKEEVNE
ncbi:MAG: DNA-directed RNA polymerase subunit beta [Alteromonas naphthalenivorans]|jgi:DNA-directed RNA polymerase subunit beta